jgi:cyclase
MLSSRIIPCLLLENEALVKSVKFKDLKYVGDPLNAVRIFNEKKVDELIVLDISATKNNQEPNYRLIESLASECRMPFCYGGGIKTVEQAKRIFSLGVEKIALSSVIFEKPELVSEIAEQVGSQSVVVVLDVKKKMFTGRYEMYSINGTRKHSIELFDFIKKMEMLGVGEFVINSIDHDGLMKGFDLNLINTIKVHVSVPLTVLGGAGSLYDIKKLIAQHKIIGVAAGSLFVFKGKYRAVLINYPCEIDKQKLINEARGDQLDLEVCK